VEHRLKKRKYEYPQYDEKKKKIKEIMKSEDVDKNLIKQLSGVGFKVKNSRVIPLLICFRKSAG